MTFSQDEHNTYAGSSQAFREKTLALLSVHQGKLERNDRDLERLEEATNEKMRLLEAKIESLQKELENKTETIQQTTTKLTQQAYAAAVICGIILVIVQVAPTYIQLMQPSPAPYKGDPYNSHPPQEGYPQNNSPTPRR